MIGAVASLPFISVSLTVPKFMSVVFLAAQLVAVPPRVSLNIKLTKTLFCKNAPMVLGVWKGKGPLVVVVPIIWRIAQSAARLMFACIVKLGGMSGQLATLTPWAAYLPSGVRMEYAEPFDELIVAFRKLGSPSHPVTVT